MFSEGLGELADFIDVFLLFLHKDVLVVEVHFQYVILNYLFKIIKVFVKIIF